MKTADLALINGKVLSVDLRKNVTRAEAVAVKDGKILAVGTSEEIKKHIGDLTEIVDCEGNTVLPGLADAHCHPSASANTYAACDLFNVVQETGESNESVIQKYVERLKAYTAAHPDSKVIRGGGWNRAFFNGSNGDHRVPDRHDLDAICSDRPMVLDSYCLHNIWVNTKALELAGLDADTPEPETGVIHREADGMPTGIFEEATAIEMLKNNLPDYDYTVEEYKEVFRKYQKEDANRYGVTLVCDAKHTDHAREAYRQMAQDQQLTLRARGVYTLDNQQPEQDWQAALNRKGKDDPNDLFQINTIKMFMEGEPCMMEPYSPEINEVNGNPPDYRGALFWTVEEGTEYMKKAIETGFQIHMHSMGSRTTKLCVDCLEEAQKVSNGNDRNVIAHLMEVRDEDAKRMGQLNIMANCQPRWMVHDTDVEHFYTPYFGREHAKRFYPNKKLLDAGCRVAYGTDFPVTPPPNPFHEIQCAMTRSVFPDAPDYRRFQGKVLDETERVSLIDAIQALTINSAYQNYLEEVTGSIEAGKSAELVLLDCDLEQLPAKQIYTVKVERTYFKGKLVYDGSESIE